MYIFLLNIFYLSEGKKNGYPPYFFTSEMEIELTQNINKIEITQNGEVITYSLKYNGNNVRLMKSISNNKYLLNSISNILSINIKDLTTFLYSQRFNYILHIFDSSYIIPQFVYFIIFNDYVKIGRTFDLKHRYSPYELKKNVKRIVFVTDVVSTEKELKKAFIKNFERYSTKSLERFNIPSYKIKHALQIFDNVVSKHKQKELVKEQLEKHIESYKNDKQYGTGYFVSDIVCSILLSTYSNINYSICLNTIKTIEKIFRKFNKNDFVSIFEEDGECYQYWKFYGYIIIVNMNTEEVNISRFWKSIIKTEKHKTKMTLYDYLRLENIQNFLKQYKIKIYSKHYIKRPLINGKWAPIVFVHLILHYLNAKYMLEVSNMLTKMIFEKRINIQSGKYMIGGSNKNNIIHLIKESINKYCITLS